MFKLVASIVNEKRNLIGFMVEGKETEFGGITSNKTVQPLQIKALSDKKFINNQVQFSGMKIIERGKFKLNELPMKMMRANGQEIVDIDNSITLTGRYLKNNEPIGFEVRFGDAKVDRYTYDNILQLSRWFKPVNYVIRKNASDREFIAGKSNVLRLEDLPTQEIGEASSAKRVKSGAKDYVKEIDNNLIPNKDIISLYEVIRECDGVVIKLPDEKYKSAGKNDKSASNEFKPLGIGEVGSPYLQFGESKLNANTTFKKVGTVNVEFNGASTPVYTYTFNTKSIFLDGDNYIKRFGIAVSKSAAAKIMESFGDTLGIKEIKETMITQPISTVIGKSNLVFFEVDTSKIALIAPSKVAEYILKPKQIRELVIKAFEPKLMSKFLSPRTGFLAEMKKVVTKEEYKGEAKPAGMFAAMSREYLDKVEEAGIDIYSGAYKKMVAVAKDATSNSESDESTETKEDTTILIDYAVDGFNATKITYKMIGQYATAGDSTKIPQSLIDFITNIYKMPKDQGTVEFAQEHLRKAEKQLEEIKRILWMHKCAMYIASNKTGIHSQDKKVWDLNTKKKTKAKVYNCKQAGCEDLAIACVNIDIA